MKFPETSTLISPAQIPRPDVEDFFKNYADVDGDSVLSYEELESMDPDLMKVNA